MGLVALVPLMDHLRAFVIQAIGDDITVVSIDLTILQIVNEVTSPDLQISLITKLVNNIELVLNWMFFGPKNFFGTPSQRIWRLTLNWIRGHINESSSTVSNYAGKIGLTSKIGLIK